MHYIKCGVNGSLLSQFWLLQKVCGTLDHCFTNDTHYSQRGWFTNILLCDIPRNKAPHTGPHHIWCTYTLCPFFGHEKNTRQLRSWVDDFTGQCLLWRLSSCKTFFAPELGLPTNLGVGRSWLFPASSIKFLTTRSLKSRWVYLAPVGGKIISWSTWR